MADKKKDNTVVHQTKVCAYCGRPYLQPCADRATAKRCGNAKLDGRKK